MNQILETKTLKMKSKKYILLFVISIVFTFFLICIYLANVIKTAEEDKFSKMITNNYKVYKLYANMSNQNILFKDDDILGNIIIPKLTINYPFFYGSNDDLLKISPCRVSGKMPNIKSNLCILGHNYNDDRFFSKISQLNIGDKIIIEDLKKNSYIYTVYENFEVDENDVYYYIDNYKYDYNLLLVTCNNFNKKRILINAKKES